MYTRSAAFPLVGFKILFLPFPVTRYPDSPLVFGAWKKGGLVEVDDHNAAGLRPAARVQGAREPLRPEACQVARTCSSLEAEQAGLRAILPGGDRFRHFDMTEIRHPKPSGQMQFVSTKPTRIPVTLDLVSPRTRQSPSSRSVAKLSELRPSFRLDKRMDVIYCDFLGQE
ncbi:hypothetical protein BKA56DRAFT_611053 [Ilyonectria sp. MPI-CAGE-AT-0026]|nr:hypothetical protein BKA56DRAFT_611053 [Ilyonectria sp. MPI-CAGE-AT-0026]